MQIISGKYKGKKLKRLVNDKTRPTKNRIRESIFNIIAKQIRGANVLDPFAGTGINGAECLSRGATFVTLNDIDKMATQVCRDNMQAIDCVGQYEIFNLDYTEFLKTQGQRKFDIVFLDPPYESDFGRKAIELLEKFDMIAPNGIIVFETDKRLDEIRVMTMPSNFEIDTRDYGRVRIYFLKALEGQGLM